MSLQFSLLMFLITGGLLHSLAYQDGLGPFLKRGKPAEMPGLSRKHAAARPHMGDNPLPLNKTHAPQLREAPPMQQGHNKHHKKSDKSIKADPKPSHEHKSNPHRRKPEPSSKHKLHEPAQKSAKHAKPVPAGEPRTHLKRPLPNDGTKGYKKPVTVKKHQCGFRRV